MVKTIRTVPVIWVGNMFLAFSIAAFLEPTGIISGGTAGIGLFMQAYFHLPISATLAAVNVICFLLGLFVLGWQFAARNGHAYFKWSDVAASNSSFQS